jgi:hypothetical protein
MSDEAEMREALKAIHDEALRLARRDDLPEDAQDSVNLIISLSRYEFDVRNEKERRRAADGGTQ